MSIILLTLPPSLLDKGALWKIITFEFPLPSSFSHTSPVSLQIKANFLFSGFQRGLEHGDLFWVKRLKPPVEMIGPEEKCVT